MKQNSWNGITAAGVSLSIVCTLSVGGLFSPSFAFGVEQAIGKLGAVIGKAEISREGKPFPATKGTEIFATDTLVTSERAVVKIQFNDGSSFMAFEKSSVKIEEYKIQAAGKSSNVKAAFDVAKGKIRFFVKPKADEGGSNAVEFKTANAVMGIRGTSGFIDTTVPGKTQLVVLTGKVEVKNPALPNARIMVGASQMTDVVGAKPPLPARSAPAALLKNLGSEEKKVDPQGAEEEKKTEKKEEEKKGEEKKGDEKKSDENKSPEGGKNDQKSNESGGQQGQGESAPAGKEGSSSASNEPSGAPQKESAPAQSSDNSGGGEQPAAKENSNASSGGGEGGPAKSNGNGEGGPTKSAGNEEGAPPSKSTNNEGGPAPKGGESTGEGGPAPKSNASGEAAPAPKASANSENGPAPANKPAPVAAAPAATDKPAPAAPAPITTQKTMVFNPEGNTSVVLTGAPTIKAIVAPDVTQAVKVQETQATTAFKQVQTQVQTVNTVSTTIQQQVNTAVETAKTTVTAAAPTKKTIKIRVELPPAP